MTVEETNESLILASQAEYTKMRVTDIDDSYINFLRDIFPDEYDLIKPKEEEYQTMLRHLKELEIQ